VRAFLLPPARPSLVHLGVLALAMLTLVALAAAEAPVHGGDQPPSDVATH
jgi:hypothetical protein